MERNNSNHKKRKRTVWLTFAIVFLFLLLTISSVIFIKLNKKQNYDLTDINTVRTLVNDVYLLPSNEEPALATVTDSSKISSSFAGKVQNGDKILFYEKNKKAIVYRPSIKKVVAVEPIEIDPVESVKKNN